MEELAHWLNKYKQCTIEIIKNLEKEDYDSLKDILDDRQVALDKIETIPHTVEEITAICEELEILDIQKKATSLMGKKRDNVKEEINKLSISKNAASVYNKRVYNNYVGFNKKI